MTRASVWTNPDGLKVGFGRNDPDFDSVGVVDQPGHERELVLVLDGEKFTAGVYQFQETHRLPVGAIPLYAHAEVSEAFVLGGTTPTIQIGSTTSSAGIPVAPAIGSSATAIFGSLAEASAEALGTYTLTVTATPLTATTAGNLQVTLGGATPTVTAAGRVKLVIGYRSV